MSTLASKVAAARRHRRAVARELAELFVGDVDESDWDPAEHGGTTKRWWSARGLAHSLTRADSPTVRAAGACYIDVHAAREHAKGLVALADEQAVFEDWTRAKGAGPENRGLGVFRDGWVSCGTCGGHGMVNGRNNDVQDCPAECWQGKERAPVRGGWPGKLAREWPGDSRAPMGRSLARLGQRILDMLEGQASECQGCGGSGHSEMSVEDALGAVMRMGSITIVGDTNEGAHVACNTCHGTGHNLRGKLPGVEWSPAVRRKVRDSELGRAEVNQRRDSWTFPILDSIGPGKPRALVRWCDKRNGTLHTFKTRVCPRGEHRTAGDRIQERGWVPRSIMASYPGAHLVPRWRRGEIEHARQRREREARQPRFEREQRRIRYGGIMVSQPMQVLRLDE